MAPSNAARGLDCDCQRGESLHMSECSGLLCNLSLSSRLEGSPSVIYDVLADPDPGVFRNFKAMTYRKVLEEDKSTGQRKLEVGQRAKVRVMFVTVTFETRLHVWQDDRARSIRFQNVQEGFMRRFEGSWQIQPCSTTASSATGVGKQAPQPWLPEQLSRLLTAGPAYGSGPVPRALAGGPSLVTLEQTILPRALVCPGMKGFVRRLCAKQVQDMMEDLRSEVDRREGRAKAKGGRQPAMPAGAAAASMTLAPNAWDIWEHITPVNITIKL